MYRNLVLLLAIVSSFQNSYSQAQKEVKKVIVVEKKNVNGEVTETMKEVDGAEAESLFKSMYEDETRSLLQGEKNQKHKTISITKRISKEISDDNLDGGDTHEKIKIVTMKDGKEEVMEWNGQGEMPAEMAKEMENIEINREQNGENMTIDIVDDALDTQDGQVIILKDREENPGRNHILWKGRDKAKPNRPTNKAVLGVEIDNTDNGVVITEVIEGSAAAKAGLRRGDTILKINKTYIFTLSGLLAALSPYNPKETVKVTYLRDGEEKSTKAVLGSR